VPNGLDLRSFAASPAHRPMRVPRHPDMAEKKGIRKIFDFATLRRTLSFARPYRSRFWASFVLALLIAAISPVRPLLINRTLEEVLGSGASDAGTAMRLLYTITIVQVGVLVVETALRFLFSFLTAWMGQSVVRDLRNLVYDKIVSLRLRQFDRTPVGTLTTRAINDLESINDIFSDGLIPIIADGLSIVAILSAMFWTDWRLTLVCLVPFPILLAATYLFKESVNRSFVVVRNAVAALNAFVQERISGMAVIQSFTAEDRESRRFEEINRKHRDANISAIFAYSVFFPFVEIILAFSMGLLVWYAARDSGPEAAAAGASVAGRIVSFILLLNLLFRPLRVIADKFNVLQMGMVASERVFKVLDNGDVTPQEGRDMQVAPKGEVVFEDVVFSYVPGQPVLKGVDFAVRPGETLAIVGNTGSGKSTLIGLLTRLYDIDSGRILLDGEDIRNYRPQALRRHIGVVLQDVFLFSGSILDNITLHDPRITREDVERAARLIGIHDFIMDLPGGYDYDVRERGGTLSMGQRQLISFIRALLYDPAILVLDEATSSVDTASERLIQHAIDTMVSDRTSIVIAHRLSTIRKAHRILVLDKGQVVEAGTHEELLSAGGSYARLYRMQFAAVE
jgi:ATP-binding cassette subfamily B multidrug efflux pump